MNDTTDFQMVIIRIAVITFIAGGIASTLGVGPFDNSYTPTPYEGRGGAHEHP